jgi:hypothetical protein
MNNYRIVVKANVGFTIAASSEAEAITKANLFRDEMTEINTVENMIIEDDSICGQTITISGVAVYLDEEITADDIEDTEEES